jgi:hypothetical protein
MRVPNLFYDTVVLGKELAAVQRTFLEADLAIAATIAEIAARHYKAKGEK